VPPLLRFASVALVVLAACAPVGTPARFVTYQYAAVVPVGPFAPGDVVSVEWVARELSTDKPDAYEIELCTGLFGPWDSVQALKNQNQPMARPACPLTDAKVPSQIARARSNIGERLTTQLVAPSAPGYYDLRQIVVTGGNASVGGSVVEVRAR
jgi:hypothetical protein